MARKKKSKLNKMDVVLIIVLLLVVVFTGIMIYLYMTTLAIPDTLCVSVFGLLTGEVSICGLIKSSKEKSLERKHELEDRKYFEKLNKENENKGDE